jgi:transcription elongation GreA/GreB family factor
MLAATAHSTTTRRSSICSKSRRSWSDGSRCSKRSSLPPRSHRRQVAAAQRLAASFAYAMSPPGEVFEHQLVGPIEGDPTNGRVSIAAPIGRALVGRQRGAHVEVATPRGAVTLEVLKVATAAPLTEAA